MAEKSFRWTSDWALQFRVWMERCGEAVLGRGRAELLSAIGQTNSISAAAREIGMSYRHAWVLVQEVNRTAGLPLVEAAVGGRRGGGATLTAAGKLAVQFFEDLQAEMARAAAQALRRALKVSPQNDCLHVAAAVSLQEVVGQMLTEYALRQPATRVRVVYGASNELSEHLLQGMTADLFLSAGKPQIEQLEKAALVDRSTRQLLAKNGLAAVAAAESAISVRKPTDLLKAEVKRLALADPGCPLGKSSQTYLEQIGIYEKLLPRVVCVDNARAVLAAVHSGVADVGLAFSNETVTSGCRTLFRTPANRPCTAYFGAVLANSARRDAALELLEFFGTPAARSCFRRCGFQLGSNRTTRRSH